MDHLRCDERVGNLSRALGLVNSVMTHGAHIVSGSSTMMVDGVAVARLGDLVWCPQRNHGLNFICHVSSTQLCDGNPVAHTGAYAACGATIITGSSTFTVD